MLKMPYNSNWFGILTLALLLWCWAVTCTSAASNTRCKLRRYTHKAIQTDFNGRRCWDDVKIMSCWGYCLSYEMRAVRDISMLNRYKEQKQEFPLHCIHRSNTTGGELVAILKISDWQFPYKLSHHPVCVHGERRHASVKLRHCDTGVQPGTEIYHYVEAATCKCQACSSENTSCEWLPPDSSLLGGLILKEELEEEME